MDTRFENYRTEMIELVKERYSLDGTVKSEIENLDFFFSKELTEQINIIYEPSLCVIQVGYESPSQFSREFSRMFGVSPKNLQN